MATDPRSETATSSFFATLSDVFSSAELQQSFRAVSRGILVHEAAEVQLLEAYQRWLQGVTSSSGEKSEAKCRRRLFQTDSPKLYYLLDGKLCIPGYLIPFDEPLSGTSKIPRSQANLLDTSTYLHARDPFLSNIPNIEAKLDPKHGLLIKVRTKADCFAVTTAVIKQFAEAARGSEKLTQEQPALLGPLRSCLEPLQICLSRARQIEESTRLLVPNQYAKFSHTSFYKYRHLVFVGEPDSDTLLACYPTAERSLPAFVRSELALLPGPIKTRKTPPGKKPNPRILGSLAVKRREYVVYARALLRFISAATKVSTVRKELPALYTLADCIKQFRLLLQDAEKQNAPKAENPEKSQDKAKSKGKDAPTITLRNGPWFFSVTKGSHLIDCQVKHRDNKNYKGKRPANNNRPGSKADKPAKHKQRKPRPPKKSK